MPSPSQIRAGGAFVELFAKDSALVKALEANKKRLAQWGQDVTARGRAVLTAAAVPLAGLAAAAKVFSDSGSDLVDMAARTGASIEALSTLGYAARQTGAEMADLETGLKKTSALMTKAAQGEKEAIHTLQALGLRFKDLKLLAPEEQFRQLARQIAAVNDPAERVALAMAVWGKSGTALLGLSAEMDELERSARRLGLQMSTEDAQAADSLGDAWGELLAVGKAVAFQIGAALAPAVQSLTEYTTDGAVAVLEWIRDNRAAIVTAAKLTLAVAAVGAGLVALGATLSAAATVVGIAISAVTALSTVLAAVGAVVTFLATPFGLAVAAVGLLTAGLVYLTARSTNAAEVVGTAWANISGVVSESVGAIYTALANGNIEAAAAILWTGLKLAWTEGKVSLANTWNSLMTTLVSAAVDATTSILTAFTRLAEGLQQIGLNIVDAIRLPAEKWAKLPPIVRNLTKDFLGPLQLLLENGTALPNQADTDAQRAKLIADQQAKAAEIAAAGEQIKAGKFGQVGAADRIMAEAAAADARRAWEAAVAAGKEAGPPPADAPAAKRKGGPTPPGFAGMQSAAEKKGLGFVDARSVEGFKAIVSALQPKSDPATRTARGVEALGATARDQQRTQLRVLKQLEDLNGSDF